MKTSYRAIIVDDEKSLMDGLIGLLDQVTPAIEITGKFYSLAEVKRNLADIDADIAFLDIQLADGTGFEVLNELLIAGKKLQVIFCTAFDDYAVKAFRVNAVDYLLKPVELGELRMAVKKCLESLQNKEEVNGNGNSQNYRNFLSLVNGGERKIAIHSSGGTDYIDPDEIIRLEASGNYTVFCLKDDSQIISTRLLKEYEENLKGNRFVRVHSSHVINMKHIIFVGRSDGGYVTMSNNKQVPISRKYKNDFYDALKSMGIVDDV